MYALLPVHVGPEVCYIIFSLANGLFMIPIYRIILLSHLTYKSV